MLTEGGREWEDGEDLRLVHHPRRQLAEVVGIAMDADQLERLSQIPAMTGPAKLGLLHELGSQWTGRGVAVECGSWLGATCAALATGLVKAGYDETIYCYDRWRASAQEVEKGSRKGIELALGQNLEPLFRRHVKPFYPKVATFRGKIHRATWCGKPIEIFLLDAAKKDPRFSKTLRIFGPSWISGVTIVAFMDIYLYRRRTDEQEIHDLKCQERFLESYPKSFEYMHDLGGSSVCYRYIEPIRWGEVGIVGLGGLSRRLRRRARAR
jgi:hypothetical protein